MVYCVGLTGDIASGKTSIANLFLKLGVDTINADTISKELTQKNLPAYMKIVAHYGHRVLNQDKELDRNRLRDIIFSDSLERSWLEQLLHPLIRQEIKRRVDASTTPYCIIEIPLLITKQAYPYINRVLLVTAPREIQISRLMQRDKCSKEKALAILSTQPNINLRIKNADDTVINNMNLEELELVVNDLHHKYLQESENQNL